MKPPVLFLIFNRPGTTRQVFDGIRKFAPEKLYIAADGPRQGREEEATLVNTLREEIRKGVDWPCQVFTLFRSENLGCKDAVREAITWFFQQEEMGIILEDDCLPHDDFFSFCSDMLLKYKDDQRIALISGTNYHLQIPKIKSTYYYSRYFAIWGWASWRRAWINYDKHLTGWPEFKKNKSLDIWYENAWLKRQLQGSFDAAWRDEVNTWDIQWFFTCLFQHQLCVVPQNNLITNIGADGTHTSENLSFHFMSTFPVPKGAEVKSPQYVYPDRNLDETAFRLFEKKIRYHFIMKYIKRIKKS